MRHAAVRDHVSTVIRGCATTQIRAVRRFPHGENHTVYRVAVRDEFSFAGTTLHFATRYPD